MQEEYISIKDISVTYQVKPMTIYNWLRRRKLPFYKVGKLVRIKKTDWENFIQKK